MKRIRKVAVLLLLAALFYGATTTTASVARAFGFIFSTPQEQTDAVDEGPAATPEPTATQTPEPTRTPPPARYGRTNAGGVNVRAQASAKSEPVAQIRNAGTVCEILETTDGADGNPWHQVELSYEKQMVTGYIRGDLIDEISEATYWEAINPPQDVKGGEASPASTTQPHAASPAVATASQPPQQRGETPAPTAVPFATAPPTSAPTQTAPSVQANTAKVWIPTRGGSKYHAKQSCSGMIEARQVTQEEAALMGFVDACKNCWR